MPLFNWGRNPETSYTPSNTQHLNFVDEICRVLMSNLIMDAISLSQSGVLGKEFYKLIGNTISKLQSKTTNHQLQSEATNRGDCLLTLETLSSDLNSLINTATRNYKQDAAVPEIFFIGHALKEIIKTISYSIKSAIKSTINTASQKKALLKLNPNILFFRQFELGLIAPNQELTIKDWHRQKITLNGLIIDQPQLSYDSTFHQFGWDTCVKTIMDCFLKRGFTSQQANFLVGYCNQDGLQSVTKVLSAFISFLNPMIITTEESYGKSLSVKTIDIQTIECSGTSYFRINDMEAPGGEGRKTENAIFFSFTATLQWKSLTDAFPCIKNFKLDLKCLNKLVDFSNGTNLRTLLRPFGIETNYQELIRQANSTSFRELLSSVEPAEDFRTYFATPLC